VTVEVSIDVANIIINEVVVASATHDPTFGNNQDFESTFVRFNPAIKVQKTGPVSSAVGDTLAYGFTVTNDDVAGDGSSIRDVTLSDSIADPAYLFGDLDGDGVLETNESWFFFASYKVKATDPDPLVNTATVSGRDKDGDEDITDTDTHTTTIEFEPTIAVDKSGPALVSLGDTAVYTFTVINDGISGDGSPIRSVTVTDTLAGSATRVDGDDGDDILEVTETWIFTATHTPASTGTVTNIATASGQDGNGDLMTDTDDHSVLVYDASVEVEKTGPAKSKVGDVVAYTVTITNTTSPAAAPDLILDSVTDDPVGDLTTTASDSHCGTLIYQETCSFTYTYAVPASGPATLTNTVQARYHPLGYTEAVTDAASHALDVFRPSLQVAKAGREYGDVGDVVTYTVTITNDSSADTPILSLVNITDSLKGDLTGADRVVTSTCTDTLAIDNQCQIIYTYTVRLSDGSPLVNTVLVESQPEGLASVFTFSATHSMRVTAFAYLPALMKNYPPPWEQGTGLPAGVEVRALAVCPTNPDIVYAGFGGEGLGVYSSTNAGLTWRRTGLQDGDVYGIVVTPGACDTVYAGAWDAGVKKSVNGGSSWFSSSDGLAGAFVYTVVIDPLDSDSIYAGTPDRGVYRSLDAGASWNPWGLWSRAVVDLSFAPANQALYAATWGDGVHKRPRGTTWGDWRAVNNGIDAEDRYVYAVAVDEPDASTVFAATSSGGIYRTQNAAGWWTPVLSSPEKAYDVLVDPGDSDVVYAGTEGGVYRSAGGGDWGSWRAWNAGLGSLVARCLAIGSDLSLYVHVGTADGAWRRPR
jgi:uncharacterized repeat protein (TIGR01451 family)